MSAQKPLTVEVLAYAPTAFFHCLHCEVVWQELGASRNFRREQLESSIPDDLKQQYQQLSDWVRQMLQAYGERVRFKVIDAASIEGWFKSVRYGVHRYPAVIVDGKAKILGPDFDLASELVRQKLAASGNTSP